MEVQEQVSLKPYNTFGIDVKAARFVSVTTLEDLKEALALPGASEALILGGGSNMLLTGPISRLVIHINLKGISVRESADPSTVFVDVAAGENWHEFVMFCVNKDLGGVENLSLIPGNVGTAPVQNIGAYGVELKDVFEQCKAVHRKNREERTFTLEDCGFGYRDSVFKKAFKDQYIITEVTFRLSKKNHTYNTDYGAIRDILREAKVSTPGLTDIANAVISIRQSKLPDPKELGNSGSFFKNPVVDQKTFTRLRDRFQELPFYPVGEDAVKIPAGWLIEKAGFKGKRFGDAGVHKRQALVLVNYGNATGDEIWRLAQRIKKAVYDEFQITIEPEVNIIS